MFCIRSDVITLRFIEMYGLVTVWTSMNDGPYWVILLMYESHDMRHTGFRRLTVVNGTPRFWGVTTKKQFSLSKKLKKNKWHLNIKDLDSIYISYSLISTIRIYNIFVVDTHPKTLPKVCNTTVTNVKIL